MYLLEVERQSGGSVKMATATHFCQTRDHGVEDAHTALEEKLSIMICLID